MASREAVKTALKLLAVNFAGDISAEKVRMWVAALDDVTEAQLAAAVPRLIREHTGAFIPPVGLVREFAGANETSVDSDDLLRRIDRLGTYIGASGWQSPRVETVRDAFGDAVANAYAAAGGPGRCFGSSDTTREIAARDFGVELRASVKRNGVEVLPSVAQPQRLTSGEAA